MTLLIISSISTAEYESETPINKTNKRICYTGSLTESKYFRLLIKLKVVRKKLQSQLWMVQLCNIWRLKAQILPRVIT